MSINAKKIQVRKHVKLASDEDWKCKLDIWKVNESWSEDCKAAFKELSNLGDDWVQVAVICQDPDRRCYFNCHDQQDSVFSVAMFYSKSRNRIRGIAQFGPYSQSASGVVHTGAIATIVDTVSGILINLICVAVTISMTLRFKQILLTEESAQFNCWIERTEGKKAIVKMVVTSIDKGRTFAEGESVWMIPKNGNV